MGYATKAVKGSALVFIISILAAFIGYLIRMVLARNLTPSEYGLFFAVLTLINFIATFKSLGLGQALIKYIPEFQVKRKFDLIKTTILTVLKLNLIFFVFLSILLYISNRYLSIYYFKDPSAVFILGMFILIFIIATFKENLRNIFNAFQKMLPFSLMYLFENSFILIGILIFFYFNFKMLAPVLAYLISYLLLFVVFLPVFFKAYPFFKYKSEHSSGLTKKLLKFGIPVMLTSIGSMVILYTDTLVLTYFRPLEEVGIYNVVVPTAMLLNLFSISVRQVIFPMVSELWAKRLKKYLNQGILLLQKYSFVIVVPVALTMFSFPKILLNLFFGEAYISGALTLQLLVIGLIFFIVAGINMTILAGIGRPQTGTKILLIGAIVNLATNFFFIPRYGMLGAGITSLASYFLILVLSIFYLNKSIKLAIPWLSWIKIFFSSLVFILVIYLSRILIDINPYLEAIISVFFAGLVYLFLIFVFRVVDIKEIKELLIKKSNKSSKI